MNGVCCACCACTDDQIEACRGISCTCSTDTPPQASVCDVLGCGDCCETCPTDDLANVLAALADQIDAVTGELKTASHGEQNTFQVNGIHPKVALRLQTNLTSWSTTLRGLIVE